MIRIDAIWLATEPMDMRAGTETALARVIAVFGAAKPHCAYLFANRRANRMEVLLHDGVGVWLAARRLNQGNFHWHGMAARSNSTASNSSIGTGPAVGARWRRRCDYRAVNAGYSASLLVVVPSLPGTIGGMTFSPNLNQMTRNSFVPWRHRRCSCSHRSRR